MVSWQGNPHARVGLIGGFGSNPIRLPVISPRRIVRREVGFGSQQQHLWFNSQPFMP
jgi:hypothetical protein